MDKVLKDLKKLKDVYYETIKCNLGEDLEVSLRLLSSEEETDVHDFSAKYEQGIAYLYSIKRETVARAIVELNGNKIPETLEDDKQGKVQKHIWLRENIIKGWSQVLIDEIWQQYAKLLINMEAKINASIKEEGKEKDKE
jgi:hypothetical protein